MVAVCALVVALGGTAYAINIGSGQIQNGAVRKVDLHANSVNSSKVVDASLTNADIDLSTLGFLSNQVRFAFAEGNDNAGTQPGGLPDVVAVNCNSDERAIGGGGAWMIVGLNNDDDPTALKDAYISASMPIPARPGSGVATGWRVAGRNGTATVRRLRAYAVCVPK